jgi:single-strand DNA-binding protein
MSTSSPKATEPSRSTLSVPPPGTNLVVLRGVLSRDPEPRQLPSGDALVAYEVTVRPGAGSDGPARAESVPVAWFDPPAAATALAAGDEVVVVGRIRRRFFRAGGATASRTEVVAANVVSVRAPARARRALTALLADLDGGG